MPREPYEWEIKSLEREVRIAMGGLEVGCPCGMVFAVDPEHARKWCCERCRLRSAARDRQVKTNAELDRLLEEGNRLSEGGYDALLSLRKRLWRPAQPLIRCTENHDRL